jgi:hypothetical protein
MVFWCLPLVVFVPVIRYNDVTSEPTAELQQSFWTPKIIETGNVEKPFAHVVFLHDCVQPTPLKSLCR